MPVAAPTKSATLSDDGTSDRAASRSRVVSWLVFAGYTLITLWFTWPLIGHLGSTFYGAPGDATGGIAVMRELTQGSVSPFLEGRLMDFSAPEGLQIPWPLNIATFASTLPTWLLAKVFGAVAALNLYVIIGQIATAQATFLLARKLTGHVGAGVIAGWAYAFAPFMVINSHGHAGFIHGWVFVFLLWRMFELASAPNLRNGLFAGCAAVVCWAWNPYFLLIGGVMTATLVAAELVRAWRASELRRSCAALAWGAIPIFTYIGIVALATAKAPVSGVRDQPIEALTIYSARAYEYVVPHAASVFFGNTTEPWLTAHLHGSNFAEATLYLGISLLMLAVVGIWAALRTGDRRESRFRCIALIAIAAVAFGASAPPTVDLPIVGWHIQTPSHFIFQIAPTWRVYSRFVFVVMLGVVLLAAHGIALAATRRSRLTATLIVSAIAAIVAVDLWVETGHRWVTPIGEDPIYKVLKQQRPRGIVAEYPIEPFGYGDYSAEFSQDSHGMPILNGFGENTPEEWRALTLVKLSDPATPRRLATLGVRYVLNTHVPINGGVTPPGNPGAGLLRIGKSGYADLYRVTAKPMPSVIVGSSGFDRPEAAVGRPQWMTSSRGKIHILAACGNCEGVFRFQIHSFGRTRRVTIKAPGRKAVTLTAGPHDRRISIPVKITNGGALIAISSSPAVEQISARLGGTDDRFVSVMIGAMDFTESNDGGR
ncbi:MAG: hypothetical protein HY827_03830 [Actinobacteria bacterium]|nr:hypothetical protein [Actinomycetota bacterium]